MPKGVQSNGQIARDNPPPNSPLELDAVFHALSRGDQASFVPRLRATVKAKDEEIVRLRSAVLYLWQEFGSVGRENLRREMPDALRDVLPPLGRTTTNAEGTE